MRRFLMLPVVMVLFGGLACGVSLGSEEPLLTLSATTAPQSSPTDTPQLYDISGMYAVQGTNQQGQSYQGTAEIERTKANNYTITWTIGSQHQSGGGVFDGTTFDVDWAMGATKGKVTYTLHPDGSMSGTWTQFGVDGVGTERLTRKVN